MSDAEWIMKQQLEIKDAEIERLREKNERLREKSNERLRELIEVIHGGDISPSLWDRIVKEVGDE